MTPHPEGGFFKEVYRSKGIISKKNLPTEFSGDRNFGTSIYYLLTSDTFSAFHRINQDETWHFYEGSTIRIHEIDESGKYSFQDLGLDFSKGQVPQYTVFGKKWFAAKVSEPNSFTLVGCSVYPGFDFEDFELADKKDLVKNFPSHADIIKSLTRD